MSPSDKIRPLLDELGVEYDTSEDDTTIFYDVDGNRYTYNVNPESGWAQLYGYNLTPEQAIAATVGAGTCKFNVVIDNDPSPRHRGNICECNKCGYRCARGFIVDERFKCCPNCGRRITKED